jgi:hypothetical protein
VPALEAPEVVDRDLGRGLALRALGDVDHDDRADQLR